MRDGESLRGIGTFPYRRTATTRTVIVRALELEEPREFHQITPTGESSLHAQFAEHLVAPPRFGLRSRDSAGATPAWGFVCGNPLTAADGRLLG